MWPQNLICLNLPEYSVCVHYSYFMLIIIESYNFPKRILFKIWANFISCSYLHIDGITSYLYAKFQ